MKELVWAKLWLGRKKHDDTYLTYIMLFAKDGCVYDPESIICQRNIRRPWLIDSTRGNIFGRDEASHAVSPCNFDTIPSVIINAPGMAEAWRSPQQQPAASLSPHPRQINALCPSAPSRKSAAAAGNGRRRGRESGKNFFFFLRCLCGREHGPQMKRLITITNECFERVSAFFVKAIFFLLSCSFALGGWDNQRDTYAVADAKGFAAPAAQPT